MSKLVEARVEGFDIDDTLVMREGVTRLGGFLKGRFKPYSLPKYTLGTLPILDHTPQDIPGIKRASLYFHQRRLAIPGVPERLREKSSRGIKLLGVSGRPATLEWADMTKHQLVREELPISEIILTPHGISTTVSKADAIRKYNIEEFSDDDLKTLYFLSGLFPDRAFNYVRHGLTNIPVNNMDLAGRPNIKVVHLSEWMHPRGN